MNGKADDEDVQVTFPIRHPLARFTQPVTSLEQGMMVTYHRFEVPKKGEAKKSIIFHALVDMNRHGERGEEGYSSTSGDIPENRYSPKLKIVCQGKDRVSWVKRLWRNPAI